MEFTQEEQNFNFYKWNPWIGCHKQSQGCENCAREQCFGVQYCQTFLLDLNNFDLPLQRNSKGQYYILPGSSIALEYNGDFFVKDMDIYRSYLWDIIKVRSDCYFYISTKRPQRIKQCLPLDWGEGWNNVYISCSVQSQNFIEKRLPVYLQVPLKRYQILAAPLIEELDLEKFLKTNKIHSVSVQGEYVLDQFYSYSARPCNYKWVKKIADQCKQYNTLFCFSKTGVHWIDENGEEKFISPYSHFIEEEAEKYNLSTTNLLDLPVEHYQFKYIQKEEN